MYTQKHTFKHSQERYGISTIPREKPYRAIFIVSALKDLNAQPQIQAQLTGTCKLELRSKDNREGHVEVLQLSKDD